MGETALIGPKVDLTKPINVDAAAFMCAAHNMKRKKRWPKGLLAACAKAANCHKDTLKRWKSHDWFWDIVEVQKAQVVPAAFKGLIKAAADGDVAACKFIMKAHQPELYDDNFKRQMAILEARKGLEGPNGEGAPIPVITVIAAEPTIKVEPEVAKLLDERDRNV